MLPVLRFVAGVNMRSVNASCNAVELAPMGGVCQLHSQYKCPDRISTSERKVDPASAYDKAVASDHKFAVSIEKCAIDKNTCAKVFSADFHKVFNNCSFLNDLKLHRKIVARAWPKAQINGLASPDFSARRNLLSTHILNGITVRLAFWPGRLNYSNFATSSTQECHHVNHRWSVAWLVNCAAFGVGYAALNRFAASDIGLAKNTLLCAPLSADAPPAVHDRKCARKRMAFRWPHFLVASARSQNDKQNHFSHQPPSSHASPCRAQGAALRTSEVWA